MSFLGILGSKNVKKTILFVHYANVYQFLHPVYPFATAYFHKLSTLLRLPVGKSAPVAGFKKVYYLLRALRLMIQPLCRLYVLASLQTTLPT